jgi:branched-chain amino acid transport system substrate-binding protein
MKTIRLTAPAAALVGGLAVLAATTIAGRVAAQDTLDIGFNGPLSGPAAGWALPGLTGLQVVADEINAAGGLDVGGTKYQLVIHQFDTEYVPSKSLQGARQLVLEKNVKLILDIGGVTADAQVPFLTEHKVFYAPLATADINPKRPYVISGADYFPRGEMLRPAYVRTQFPNAKRFAIVSQEEATSLVGQAWEVGSAKALGFEIVYDEFYSPETTDFAPVVTAILASKPDVVSLCTSWPDFIPLLLEQLYLQGFKGIVAANYIEPEQALQRVPADWLEQVRAIDSYPLFDDPWWGEPSAQHDFHRKWLARFGPGAPEDQQRAMNGIDWLYAPMLQAYLAGVQKAGTLDADKVLEAIRSFDTIQTIQGATSVTGEEMWGERNMISPLVPTNEFRQDCKCKRVQSLVRFETWFEQYKDTVTAEVRARGQMWDQRQ